MQVVVNITINLNTYSIHLLLLIFNLSTDLPTYLPTYLSPYIDFLLML